MTNTENKIIMYDSPEAAEQITLTGWVSGGDKKFWYKDEHMARWSGCTHLKCECGGTMEKSWTKCEKCRHNLAVERYNKLPFKDYDGSPVWDWDGNEFFVCEDDLIEYMESNELAVMDLLFSEPIYYRQISLEDVSGDDVHEDWEPEDSLLKEIEELNNHIKAYPAHSYTQGKIRSSYKL